jgi:hypothetical protein
MPQLLMQSRRTWSERQKKALRSFVLAYSSPLIADAAASKLQAGNRTRGGDAPCQGCGRYVADFVFGKGEVLGVWLRS